MRDPIAIEKFLDEICGGKEMRFLPSVRLPRLTWLLFLLSLPVLLIACGSGISEDDLAKVNASLRTAQSDAQTAQTRIQELEKQLAPGFKETDSGTQIAVVLSGTATGETREISGSPMECFDVDLLDPSSGKVIGKGTDCLDLNSIEMIGDDGGMQLNNTTFFKFDEGTIVSISLTAVQPFSDPLPSSGPTHITGEVSTGDNIIADMGTGKYEGVTGSTRLSGSIDMSKFDGPGTEMTFDCIFVITLSKS